MASKSRARKSETVTEPVGDTAEQAAGEDTSFNYGAGAQDGPQTIAPAVEQALADAQARQEAPAPEVTAAQVNGEDVQQEEKRPVPNPRPWENRLGRKENRVHLLRSDPEQRYENGAWVIRFDKKPDDMEGYSKDNPHPVKAYLKSEGFAWGFDHDGKGGWGKQWTVDDRGRPIDPFGDDHIDARRVMHKAAEMVGAEVSQGRAVG